MRRLAITFLSLGGAMLALSACEVRREGEEDIPAEEQAPAPAETAAVEDSAPPEPEASESPANSIIREEVREEPAEEQQAVAAEPLSVTIGFPGGGTDIDDAAEQLLLTVLQSDAIDEDWPLILRGHSDSAGNDMANLRESRARAEAVAAWLVERGVDDARITVIAFGEQNPVAANALPDGTPDEAGRSRNRRVELEIAPPPAAAPYTGVQAADDA